MGYLILGYEAACHHTMRFNVKENAQELPPKGEVPPTTWRNPLLAVRGYVSRN
jgi:hypothetical protein